jgi:TPP-dependent pyruvate/acetoin dehydrogenase alpha subunit
MVTKSRNQSAKASRKKTPPKSQTASPAKAASSNGSGPSTQETLRRLYTSLLRCRLVQEEAQSVCARKYDIAIGHEAIAVAPTAELTAEDTITATDSNLSAMVTRGVPVNVLLGSHADCISAYSVTQGSLPQDPFHLATGIALAHQLSKQNRVVVAFCAHESPALETWHDTLKFAGVHKLPVIYVIKNGVADQKSSADHAPHLEAFSYMARDYGYPGIIVDGHDVVAVWRAAHESIHRARTGSGPTLIDCRTDSGQDPLAYLEHYMRKRNLWDDGWKKKTEARISAEISSALIPS